MKNLLISSNTKNYPVIFVNDLNLTLKKLRSKYKLHVLIDKKIANFYKNILQDKQMYSSFKTFESIEDKKSIEEISSYIEFLLKHNIHKDHKLIVIGGGLVQDIGSFVAHVLLRGIDWIFIPTTLLAMADSCIGSKSGINVGKYKNQIGTFHPPSEIYIYLPFLRTLSKAEMLNGIGEIIKHALIKGGKSFNFISKNVVNLSNEKVAHEIIHESLLIKKNIIEKDEYEKNIRKVLNYGHTFGHALEGYTSHKIPHGIAVLIGIDIANYISVKNRHLNISDFKKIHDLIIQYTSSYSFKITNYNSYMDYLSHDKKVIGNSVYVILCKGIGKIEIIKINLDKILKEYIKEYFLKYRN